MDIIILDFSKGFDSVNHRKLVHKLHKIGLHQEVVLWIEGFLENPAQFVAVDGQHSTRPVISGVSQGSVLGSLLFLFK